MAGIRHNKRQKTPTTFEFTFDGKTYIIRQNYKCQPTTLVLSDGQIVKVTAWKLGVPFEPVPDQTTTFDPQQQRAAQLARAAGGFVAELQASDDATCTAKATEQAKPE